MRIGVPGAANGRDQPARIDAPAFMARLIEVFEGMGACWGELLDQRW